MYRKNAWKTYDADAKKAVMEFNENYKNYINTIR